MFFIAYVLCCLRLLELRTEGQTKKQKSLPKKLESTFSLILVNFKVLQGTGSRSLIISIENAQAVIIFGFELQIVPHYADLSYHLQYTVNPRRRYIFKFVIFHRVTFCNSIRTIFNKKWTLLS